jgi:hypothetical protein
MQFEIAQDILDSAKHCQKEFACLTNGTGSICAINIPVGSEVCFVERSKGKACRYADDYGYHRTICTCPVRKEIWKRYGK